MKDSIYKEVDNYIKELLAPEDEALSSIESGLIEAGIPVESVSANQGKFLQILALMCKAEKILEIGTLGGYSTIWLARALPDHGKIFSIELDKQRAEVAKTNIAKAGLSHKVEIIIGNAIEVINDLKKNAPFDFFFIDADKPSYIEYFNHAIELSRTGSIIVADNVIREGKILDKESADEKVKGVQRFNEMLSQNKKVTATILQNVGIKYHDGMAIAVVN